MDSSYIQTTYEINGKEYIVHDINDRICEEPPALVITTDGKEFKYCHICGEKLTSEKFEIPIDGDFYVNVYGGICNDCGAFFCKDTRTIIDLESCKKTKKEYSVKSAQLLSHNVDKFKSRFKSMETGYKLYHLKSAFNEITITIVTDPALKNQDRFTFLIGSFVADKLEGADQSDTILFNNIKYKIVEMIENKYCVFPELQEQVIEKETVIENDDVIPVNKENVEKYEYNGKTSIPEINSEVIVYVYKGNIKCEKEHRIRSFRAEIPFLDKTKIFYIDYCYDCGQFILKYADYKKYFQKMHFFPFKTKPINVQRKDYRRSEISELMNYGYSVSQSAGLSDNYRHELLKWIVDTGKLKKREVLNYLDLFMETNGMKENMELAVSKWQCDRNYVFNNVDEPTGPIVQVFKLLPRR